MIYTSAVESHRGAVVNTLAFEYEFSDDIVVRVTQIPGLTSHFLRALFWVSLLVLISLLAVSVNELGESPDIPIRWMMGLSLAVTGGILIVMLALLSLLYAMVWRTRRRLRSCIASLTDPTIRWQLADASFRVTMSQSDREVPWGEVKRVSTGDDFWTLWVNEGPELFIPAECLNESMKELIRSRTTSAEKVQRKVN